MDKDEVQFSIAEGTKLRKRGKSNSNENENTEVASSSTSGVQDSRPNSLHEECGPETETLNSTTRHFKKDSFYALFAKKEPFYICQFLEDSDSNYEDMLCIKWFDKNEDGNYCFEKEDEIEILKTVIKEVKLEDLGEGVFKLSREEEEEIEKTARILKGIPNKTLVEFMENNEADYVYQNIDYFDKAA